MKRYIYFWVIAFGLLLLSCGKDEAVVIDEVWKAENEKVFNDLTYNPAYSRLLSPSNAGHIYYKVIKEGSGSKQIYYTSRVQAYYTGSLIDGSVFDSVEPPYKAPAEFSVRASTVNTSGVVDGWSTALQHMKEGDRWEIWIPQALGYKTTEQKNSAGVVTIPAYSTLKFEVEVVKVIGIEE
jgi:peptidylprolyl isomerase/FKBP-type peptidyl-prolyl cis-trans isomerase FklB